MLVEEHLYFISDKLSILKKQKYVQKIIMKIKSLYNVHIGPVYLYFFSPTEWWNPYLCVMAAQCNRIHPLWLDAEQKFSRKKGINYNEIPKFQAMSIIWHLQCVAVHPYKSKLKCTNFFLTLSRTILFFSQGRSSDCANIFCKYEQPFQDQSN